VLDRHPKSRCLRCPHGPANRRDPNTGIRQRFPSDLGGAKVLPGEGPGAILTTRNALRRGRLVHLLLEHLPNVPPAAWRETAPRIAALEAPDVSRTSCGSLQRSRGRADRAASCACLCAGNAGRGRAAWRERRTEGCGSGRHRSVDRGGRPCPCYRLQDQRARARPAGGRARGSVAADGCLCRDAARHLPDREIEPRSFGRGQRS
jgi:hypothetical protein